jgi:hypothetical protein
MASHTILVGGFHCQASLLGIRNRSIKPRVIIANKIGTVGDEAAGPKATAQRRVCIINTGVDNTNLDALASNALSSQLVHLGHQVGRESVIVHLSLDVAVGGIRVFASAGPHNVVLGKVVDSVLPDPLDARQICELRCLILCGANIVKLDRRTLEQGGTECYCKS